MARVEQGRFIAQQAEGKGVVEGYKKFNKLTRNIGIGVGVAGLAVGAAPLVTLGFGAALIDQGQIIVIDKYQKWRAKKSQPRMLPKAA